MNWALWIIIGPDLFTEADMYNVTASVNRFSEAVFVTASVNRKRTPLLMLGINRDVFFLCTPHRHFSSASQNSEL